MGTIRLVLMALLYCAAAAVSNAQTGSRAAQAAREYRLENEHAIVGELVELLRIPNVAADTPNIQRNAEKLREMLERRGFSVRLLRIAGRGPVVFGELAAPGAARTVVFYSHYDGQPVDPGRWVETRP
jgi:acetylornithine deacetylase/succinyl-diaminopimelate desuccinylase-like protein